MLSQRYALIQQRILRHELFRRTDILRNQLQHKLTPIESLLGQKAQRQNGDSILLLGILLEIEQGRYYLEDFTGQVPVSFRDATVTEGWYVTPHSIVLAEGIFVDGLFYILRMGQPLPERRHDSLQAIRQHVAHPDYALPSSRPHAVGGSHHLSDQSFVVLSEVHLDQPKVQQQLEALLAMYEKCNTDRFPTFILMGNFSSAWTTTVPSSSTSMDELLNMIAKFPSLSEHGRFCIVPGPRDGTASPVLPFPAIRGNHRPKIAGAAARPMSNPCRIRFQQNHPNPGGEGNSTNNYDIIVFRYNLLRIFQQHSLSLPTSSSTKENNDIDANDDDDKRLLRSPHCRLVKTVLDQGHLIPVAGAVPVYWNYDHALSLYPLPNVLILADDDIEEPFHERYEGCDVIHPGSFAKDGSYAIYHNDCRRYDDDDDVEDFDTSLENGPVEFLRLGG
jgi:DNA polymerase epsilon subunit 2